MTDTSHQDPDMRAAEYVLGTLPAEEAVELERALAHDQALQAEVAYWEEQLGQLGLGLDPVDPPADVWTAIQARIKANTESPTPPPEAAAPSRPAPPARRGGRFWPGLAIAASVACLVLAGLLYQTMKRPVPGAAPTYIGMFHDKPTDMGWVVTASIGSGDMSITAMGDYSVPKGKELRLWVIPKGKQPIASGLMPPQGHSEWAMQPRVTHVLSHPGTTLAVTLEDAGQPVSDGPKGPVMWQSAVHQSTG